MKYTIEVDVVTSSISATVEIGDNLIILNGNLIAVEKNKCHRKPAPKEDVENSSITKQHLSEKDILELLQTVPNGMTARSINQHFGDSQSVRDRVNELLRRLISTQVLTMDKSVSAKRPHYTLFK